MGTPRLPGIPLYARRIWPDGVQARLDKAASINVHALDGCGYQLAADVISELQAINPQVASHIARSFDRWRQFDAGRQAHARAAIEGLRRTWRKSWGMR
ncbi:MAG: aminopeptidase N C-terminal domain-containing protein [Thiobacillus sp.]|uniref:aminopeptidase N C-terminal domain-containing protein n=1 Tax=Thiobacillus sp. TaxID=924 RepID=UPI00168C1C2C|nr:MAG: aminopeptidase N C-terminal domain-containing protein [Thiobacillus sp.]